MITPLVCYLVSSIKVAVKHKVGHGVVIFSKFNLEVIKKLYSACIIESYTVIEEGSFKKIKFTLVYRFNHFTLDDIKLVSKPGRRVYSSYTNLKKYLKRYPHALVSTNKGLLTYKECMINRVGGEVILIYR